MTSVCLLFIALMSQCGIRSLRSVIATPSKTMSSTGSVSPVPFIPSGTAVPVPATQASSIQEPSVSAPMGKSGTALLVPALPTNTYWVISVASVIRMQIMMVS